MSPRDTRVRSNSAQALENARPDLAGHELHGATRERGVDPIVTCVEERSERADLFAESDDLVCDPVRCARDDERGLMPRGQVERRSVPVSVKTRSK